MATIDKVNDLRRDKLQADQDCKSLREKLNASAKAERTAADALEASETRLAGRDASN